jgi:hypothetical protein
VRRRRPRTAPKRGTTIERPTQIDHRTELARARGLELLDNDTRALLGRLRWRQPPLGRKAVVLALVAVLLLHGLFALVIWYEMRPKAQHVEIIHMNLDQALQLRLLDQPATRTPSIPPPPSLPAPKPAPQPAAIGQAKARPVPPRLPARPVVHEPARPDAMTVQEHGAAAPAPTASAAAPPVLYSKDGTVLMPPAPAPVAVPPKPDDVKDMPSGDSQVMHHDKNLLHYKATRFDKYFPPTNETAAGTVGRHVGNVIKAVTKSVCDPKGGAVTSMLCGTPPIPPSPKDGDERLNMAPTALAKDPHPPAPPAIATCIAEYRATKPLSYGCPMDTPDQSFKAELRECIDQYRAGKRLQTWCPADTPKRAAAEAASAGAAH